MSRTHLSGKHGRLPLSMAVRRDCLIKLRDMALSGNAVAAAELVKIGMLTDEIEARAGVIADQSPV